LKFNIGFYFVHLLHFGESPSLSFIGFDLNFNDSISICDYHYIGIFNICNLSKAYLAVLYAYKFDPILPIV